MLHISNLGCHKGDRLLFSDVSFELKPGEWLHLQGDNGSGKTSLLRLVSGLAAHSIGHITWNGPPPDAEPTPPSRADMRAHVVYMGHQLALKDDLSAFENLQTHAKINTESIDDNHAMDALAQLGLRGREHLAVKVLSQGQKRRAALARLLVSPASLWLLDEPFVALDTKACDRLTHLINQHIDRGGMVLLTSHQAVTFTGQGHAYRLAA